MTDQLPPLLGTIGVTPTYGSFFDRFIGASIRYVTATQDEYHRYGDAKVNHAVVFVGDVAGYDKPQLIQAQPGGASYADWDSYGDNMIWLNDIGYRDQFGWHPLKLTDEVRKLIAANARAQLGKPYGYRDIVAIGLAQKRMGSRIQVGRALQQQPWWVKRLVSSKTLICSQLADLAYQLSGIELFNDRRFPGFVSPADLYGLKS